MRPTEILDGVLMARPTSSDDYVKRRAAEIILPEIRRWLGPDHSSDEDTVRELMKVAYEHKDGYELCRDLESYCGWCGADDSLVEILGGDWVTRALEELTDQWVRCLGIIPEFKLGDHVQTALDRRKGEIGTVVKIDERLAKYGIHYPGMSESSYYVVEFERCTAATPHEIKAETVTS